MSHLSGAGIPPTATPPNTQSQPCALSIVVGSVNSARSIVRSLESLERACAGLDAEVLVIDASSDATVSRITESRPATRVWQMRPGTLTPQLWSAGLSLARGRVVAFTTGHFAVSDTWARSLLAEVDRGATGVAGPISLSAASDPVDWAVFYLRYSAFLGTYEREDVPEIPGDNAAYRRDALERHAASFAGGFWEVDFHRRLRAEDWSARLAIVPAAEAQFGPSDSLVAFTRQRFAHGSHFGGWRVHSGARAAWKIVVSGPMVPFLLVARIARRVLSQPVHRVRFMVALPPLFVLAAAWAVGEVWGALTQSEPSALRQPRLVA